MVTHRTLMTAVFTVCLALGTEALSEGTERPSGLSDKSSEFYDQCVEDPSTVSRVELKDPIAACACLATEWDKAMERGRDEHGAYRFAVAVCAPALQN